MAGALLLNAGDPGAVVPVPTENPYPDLFVAPNFERFDGLGQPPLDAPAVDNQFGTPYGATPRPGQENTPPSEQTYTPGALVGVTGTIGGQPLPVHDWKYNPGKVTLTTSPSIQHRLGVGQHGPSELGAAQTVVLGGITNNPPEPGDLSAIIAGLG